MTKLKITLALHIIVVITMLLSLVMYIRFIRDENSGWNESVAMPIIGIAGLINAFLILYQMKLWRKKT